MGTTEISGTTLLAPLFRKDPLTPQVIVAVLVFNVAHRSRTTDLRIKALLTTHRLIPCAASSETSSAWSGRRSTTDRVQGGSLLAIGILVGGCAVLPQDFSHTERSRSDVAVVLLTETTFSSSLNSGMRRDKRRAPVVSTYRLQTADLTISTSTTIEVTVEGAAVETLQLRTSNPVERTARYIFVQQ